MTLDLFPDALYCVGVVAAVITAYFLGIEKGRDLEKKGGK